MSNTNPDDHDERDRDDDRSDERTPHGGPFGLRLGAHIGTLLDFLDEQQRRSRGRRGRGGSSGSNRVSIDSNVSIGSGLGDASEDRLPPRMRNPPGDSERSRTKRHRPRSNDYMTTTRNEDDALVVTADLPGVPRDDLSVGVTKDREKLVIGVGDTVVDRIPLAGADPDAIEATYNNFVLDVRVEDREGTGDEGVTER